VRDELRKCVVAATALFTTRSKAGFDISFACRRRSTHVGVLIGDGGLHSLAAQLLSIISKEVLGGLATA
jgi:hypothetical protein